MPMNIFKEDDVRFRRSLNTVTATHAPTGLYEQIKDESLYFCDINKKLLLERLKQRVHASHWYKACAAEPKEEKSDSISDMMKRNIPPHLMRAIEEFKRLNPEHVARFNLNKAAKEKLNQINDELIKKQYEIKEEFTSPISKEPVVEIKPENVVSFNGYKFVLNNNCNLEKAAKIANEIISYHQAIGRVKRHPHIIGKAESSLLLHKMVCLADDNDMDITYMDVFKLVKAVLNEVDINLDIDLT